MIMRSAFVFLVIYFKCISKRFSKSIQSFNQTKTKEIVRFLQLTSKEVKRGGGRRKQQNVLEVSFKSQPGSMSDEGQGTHNVALCFCGTLFTYI